MMRCRLQKFDPEGKLLLATGSQGDTAGSFARPKQIAVDRDGIVYVIDAAFQNVQMFDDQFQVLMHFGAAGEFPGAMNLPAGICVSDEGLELFKDRAHPGFKPIRIIAVSNQFGPNKVSIYLLGERRPEYSLADLNASAANIDLGMGEQSPEMKRIQSPGGVELGMPVPATGGEAQPAAEGEQPQPPPPSRPPAADPAQPPAPAPTPN
jgi:hypothetical protein